MHRIGLLPRLLIGILSGVLIGLFFPEWVARLLFTFTHLFGQFLGFIVPLIIVGFIAAGVAELGSRAGKLLAGGVGMAYGSTILAGLASFFVALMVVPLFITEGAAGDPDAAGLTPFLQIATPPVMGVMSALVMAFLLGLGINHLRHEKGKQVLYGVMEEFRTIIVLVIVKVIIPLLPLHIAGIFADMAATGEVIQTLQVFALIFVLILSLHLVWLLSLYSMAAARTGKNPFVSLRTMLPAYTTALGTMSSAATIPVTLQSTKNNGVSERIAEFLIPLLATIHLAGSTISLVVCSIAVVLLSGDTPELAQFFPFILLLGVTMIAAPGVPGGAVMAALGLMSSILGFTDPQLGLMLALYMAQDGFGTACNVTGDGAISLMIDSFNGSEAAKTQG